MQHTLIKVWQMLLVGIALCVIVQHTWWADTPMVIAVETSRNDLDLTIAPPILLADGTAQSVIYLQILGLDDVPRLASDLIEVSLVSSDPQIVSVPDLVYILPGQSYTIASLTTTLTPGNAVISTVSRHYKPVTAEVQTVGGVDDPMFTRLVLYAGPVDLLPNGEPPGLLSIVLLDGNENLMPAPEDLHIVLSSSAPDVVYVRERITIPKGDYFATADLVSLAVGSATLTAVHPGYASEFIDVNVVEPGDHAAALLVYVAPPILRTHFGDQSTVVIQATDDKGAPYYFPCDRVILASSSSLSIEVLPEKERICGSNTQYLTGTVAAGYVPSTTTITAVSSGMRPASTTIEVQGQVPTLLKAYLAPSQLLSLDTTPGFIIAQVLDAHGVPVQIHGGLSVKPVGGGEAFTNEWWINDGRSFATIELSREQIADQAKLWLLNPGLQSASIDLNRHVLPTTLQVQSLDGPLKPGEHTKIRVRVESDGLPLSGSQLEWRVANGKFWGASTETDSNGEASVLFLATATAAGFIEVTADKRGYEKASGGTVINVVTPVEIGNSGPRLVGIPVLYVYLMIVLLLVGYLGLKLYQSFGRSKPIAWRR